MNLKQHLTKSRLTIDNEDVRPKITSNLSIKSFKINSESTGIGFYSILVTYELLITFFEKLMYS